MSLDRMGNDLLADVPVWPTIAMVVGISTIIVKVEYFESG